MVIRTKENIFNWTSEYCLLCCSLYLSFANYNLCFHQLFYPGCVYRIHQKRKNIIIFWVGLTNHLFCLINFNRSVEPVKIQPCLSFHKQPVHTNTVYYYSRSKMSGRRQTLKLMLTVQCWYMVYVQQTLCKLITELGNISSHALRVICNDMTDGWLNVCIYEWMNETELYIVKRRTYTHTIICISENEWMEQSPIAGMRR